MMLVIGSNDKILSQFDTVQKTVCLISILTVKNIPGIESATYIREHFSGKIPNDRNKMLQIPGVGDYTAGAILTVCYKKKEYVVDSNIARLINRYHGLGFTGEIRRKKRIIEFSRSIFKTENPGKMLFAIIDFTAIVCKPLHPLCSSCDLRIKCKYGSKNVSKKDN